MTQVIIIVCYMGLLIGLGLISRMSFRGTAKDYFVASQSIGPFVLLMSVFGTTMTAFALVGSTGEAYKAGIGVYGLLASWSGLVHAAVFFLIGIKLWSYGSRYGYVTQIQFFRDRFESSSLGLLLFPILVALVIPYLLTGLLGAGGFIKAITAGSFPDLFTETGGAIPNWLTSFVICGVVLFYIFFGGLRGAAWANTFQTIVFMIVGIITFIVISRGIGGPVAATQAVMEKHPELLTRESEFTKLHFLTYGFVPLSVGMFPHLFQHWLTAKSAKTFRLTVVAHPIFIMIVWAPCVMIGVWASSALMPDGSLVVPIKHPPNSELGIMIGKLTGPLLGGILSAGVLAAIMSSLDSQFVCLGTMFTNDIVLHHFGKDRFSDRQQVMLARGFIIAIVAITFALSLAEPRRVFTLGVWCFSGFASLFPIVFASVYWRRVTRMGAFASIFATIVVWLLLFAASDYGKDRTFLFLGMMPVATIFTASAAALIGVSLMTQPPSQATIDKFIIPRPGGIY